MTAPGLVSLIVDHRIADAVRSARLHPVEWVTEQLDYDTLDDHAEAASKFVEAWCSGLPPGERLRAATWAAGQYVTAMVHLDHAYGIAARLMLGAQAAAANELARSLRETWVLADGPDAELKGAVAERLVGYADALDAMSFEPAWIEGSPEE